MSKRIAVIGIGNILRRDDGIGIGVLESLLKFYKKEGIGYLNFGIASFDLLHQIENYDLVILIDGIKAGLAVGEVKIFKLQDIEYEHNPAISSTHELDLKSLFELSKNLGLKAKIYVAGIQVADTAYGEGLSAALIKRKEEIVREVSVFIDKELCLPL